MLDRDGQHRGVVTKPLANVVPPRANSRRVAGMTPSVPIRWSSVRMTRMFGRADAARVVEGSTDPDFCQVGDGGEPVAVDEHATRASVARQRPTPRARALIQA